MYEHQLPLKLFERSPRELLMLESAEEDVFAYEDKEFIIVFQYQEKITKEKVRSLISKNVQTVFVSEIDNKKIEENILERLRSNSRSLSIGDAFENSYRHLSLMTLNLKNLYQTPLNDDILKLLFQCSGNFVNFSNESKHLINQLYLKMNLEPVHYSRIQPLLSSMLLLGFCQSYKIFSPREVENLFVTSYFKDFGMCYLSAETLDKEVLNTEELKALEIHPYNTLLLLENRLPLNRSSLEIISHHHFLNDKIKVEKAGAKKNQVPDMYEPGIETYLVAIFDIIAAMTNERPYRKSWKLYETLDLIKKVMADRYPHEFKAIVHYLKNFFNL